MFSRIKNYFIEYQELKFLAYHDSLTGLLNRNWLYKNSHKIKTKYVYFIDINNLHEINKNGHSFGDKYIKDTISSISARGTLIRYAGDEFLLFSDFKNEIETNKLFAVGFSEIKNDIFDSINEADLEMLKSKNKKHNPFNKSHQ